MLQNEEIYNRAILGVEDETKLNFNKNYSLNIQPNKLTTPFTDSFNISKVSKVVTTNNQDGGQGIAGWSTNLKFYAVDNNTVSWNTGKIYYPNGTVFEVSSGSTGDMNDITYVYLDEASSSLLTTTNPQEAVGNGKLLICVAGPVDDTKKKATFQVFGTDGKGVFITADNIAANTITGNELVMNTITSREINTSSINIGEWDGTIDDVSDGTTYAKIKSVSLQDGMVLFDKVLDGTTYGKVKKTALTSDGLISLDATVNGNYAKVKAAALNSDGLVLLDQVVDGDYGKVKKASLTADGLILMDQVVDGDYGKVKKTSLTADGLVLLSETQGTLDDIDDGSDYGKVLKTSISAGKILLSETVGTLDDIGDGENYAKVSKTSISGGKIILSETIGTIDDIDDGDNYAKIKKTYINAGKIDLIDGKKELLLDFNKKDPTIHFRTEVNNKKTDVGYIYGHSATQKIGGKDMTINGIYTSSNLGTLGSLFIKKDAIIGDDALVAGDFYVYGSASTYRLKITGSVVEVNGKMKIPVGSNLYD